MLISHRHRFVFIHLLKTGGDSVTAALKPVLGRTDFIMNNEIEAWIRSNVFGAVPESLRRLHKHSSAEDVCQSMPIQAWNDYFKFAFVRHPVSRAVSLYKYAGKKADERARFLPRNFWYQTPPGRVGDPIKWPMVRAYLRTDSFSAFIRDPLLHQDLGFQPQWKALCNTEGQILIDFVGRFERLSEDFGHVLEALSLDFVELGQRNVSDPGSIREVAISTEDQKFLEDRFQDDFAIFGYDPEHIQVQ